MVRTARKYLAHNSTLPLSRKSTRNTNQHACLKNDDRDGWLTPGKPPISVVVRQGNSGVNDAKAERATFPRRDEEEWTLARTVYTAYHLHPDETLFLHPLNTTGVISYAVPKGSTLFRTAPFASRREITGHPTARLSVALQHRDSSTPSEIDLFVTFYYYATNGSVVFYTGAVGDAVPVVRGWLRVSLRKLSSRPTKLSAFMTERDYLSADVEAVEVDTVYTVDVELWPTSFVAEEGKTLGFEVASSDDERLGISGHDYAEDRVEGKLKGLNEIHIGSIYDNFVTLPVIPEER